MSMRQPMIMAKFMHLPNEILFYLFKSKFALQEHFHLRLLCRRLQSLIECACIGKRASLKLFFSFLDVQQYTEHLYFWKLEHDSALRLKNRFDDDLILSGSKFTRSTVDWLVGMFPRLNHLFIQFNTRPLSPPPTAHYPVLPYLISRWSNSLVRLTLFGLIYPIAGQKQLVGELCHEINESLPALRQLDLLTEDLFYCDPSDPIIVGTNGFVDIPIELTARLLAQLDRLNLLTHRPHNEPKQLFPKLSDDSTKLHIFYNYSPDMENHLSELYYTKSRDVDDDSLAAVRGVTHLTMHAVLDRWKPIRTLNRLVSLFTGLRSLCLEQLNLLEAKQPCGVTLVQVLRKLTNLTHLNELKLRNFQLSQLGDIQRLKQQTRKLRMGSITHLTIQEDRFESCQIESLGCAVYFASICLIFPAIRSLYFLLQESLSQPLDPTVHFAQFSELTRVELCVYKPTQVAAIPHLFSLKHRRRFEADLLQAEPVDRIGRGQAGWEVWSRRQTTIEQESDEGKNKKFVWTKEKALVYDATKLEEIIEDP